MLKPHWAAANVHRMDTTLWLGGRRGAGEKASCSWPGRNFKVQNSPGPSGGIRDQDVHCGNTGTQAHRSQALQGVEAYSRWPSGVPSVTTLLTSVPGAGTPPWPWMLPWGPGLELGAHNHCQPALQETRTCHPLLSHIEATHRLTLLLQLKELPKLRQNRPRSGGLGDTFCIQEC